MSVLREHVREFHPRLRLRRRDEDLAREHARYHHHHHSDHTHGPVASKNNTGPLVGYGSELRRPIGWYTGENAVLRKENDHDNRIR
jgi:hypothetical protein